MKFELYYPVSPIFITQKFGETVNLQYYLDNKINVVGHNGIDILAKHGQPVYASHDGIANYQIDSSAGHGVVIRTKDKYDYNGEQVYFKTIYWHLCDSKKEPQYRSPLEGHVDVEVKTGDLIGYADSTGLSTGDHLHYGCKPMALNEANNTWFNTEQHNGYNGNIDPAQFFNGKFAKDRQLKHIFRINLEYGQTSEEVKELQKRLQGLGYFPATQECTGYYGDVTRKAVFAFQQENLFLNFTQRFIYKGKYFSAMTRGALNNL